MTIVEDARAITGGVDTHSEVHVAAALDPVGGLLGTREFPVGAAGYAGLLDGLGGFGDLALVGVEGTGSYARAWPGTSRPMACGSWKLTAPTGRTVAARASLTPWTRSARPVPRSRGGRPGRRRAVMGRPGVAGCGWPPVTS